MRKRTRRIIFFTTIGIIIVLATILIVLLVIPKDGALRIHAGGDVSQNQVADYSDSYINLHKNGTFDMEIIYVGEVIFVAHGTYKLQDNRYYFTYHDAWMFIPDELKHDPEDAYINQTKDYELYKKHGIAFTAHDYNTYCFA